MFMNNVIILLLAVQICEESDNRGSDKREYTVYIFIIIRTSVSNTHARMMYVCF